MKALRFRRAVEGRDELTAEFGGELASDPHAVTQKEILHVEWNETTFG